MDKPSEKQLFNRAYSYAEKHIALKHKILNPESLPEYEEKPWRDPESLFCDMEFLTKLMGKPLPSKAELKLEEELSAIVEEDGEY